VNANLTLTDLIIESALLGSRQAFYLPGVGFVLGVEPALPEHREAARAIVRAGLADVVAWLGYDPLASILARLRSRAAR